MEFSREERALEKATGEMRLLMEKVSRERRAAGDPRRVTEESVMGNIVRPVVWGSEGEAEPQGGDTAVIPRLKEESAVPLVPEHASRRHAGEAAKAPKEDDPFAGIASSWGGWSDDGAPTTGAGIVGCTPRPEELPRPAMTRTAWDRDGDL